MFAKEVHMKRQTGFRLTERAHEWLREQAQERGISKNDVVQELINEKMSGLERLAERVVSAKQCR
jgi:predicted HicB family RNase H-like nuclease